MRLPYFMWFKWLVRDIITSSYIISPKPKKIQINRIKIPYLVHIPLFQCYSTNCKGYSGKGGHNSKTDDQEGEETQSSSDNFFRYVRIRQDMDLDVLWVEFSIKFRFFWVKTGKNGELTHGNSWLSGARKLSDLPGQHLSRSRRIQFEKLDRKRGISYKGFLKHWPLLGTGEQSDPILGDY